MFVLRKHVQTVWLAQLPTLPLLIVFNAYYSIVIMFSYHVLFCISLVLTAITQCLAIFYSYKCSYLHCMYMQTVFIYSINAAIEFVQSTATGRDAQEYRFHWK